MSLLSYPLLARTVPEKSSQANVYYEEAETARMALQQIPANQRTLKDYNHVILAFRKVYATAPASSRNPKSLMAIGELYQTMAFNMKDEKYLASAVKSYDFLLQEYPHSLFRTEAMLAAARIFQSDLRQPEEARKRYENFLQAFPNSPDREVARLGIAQIDAGVGTAKKKEPENPVANETKVAATQSNGKATVALSESRNSSETKIEAAALNSAQKRANDAAQTKAIRDTVEQPPAQAQQVSTLPRLPRNDTPIKARPAAQDQPKISEESRLGNPPQAQGQIESPAPEHESLNAEQTKEHTAVTDVRAWSTPASTRVVIDVGQVVRHEVGRLDNPPRIYLDLYGARIHRTVSRTISKKNPVTDGGLVKGLRAAQYQPDVTRIVAEVAQRTEYSVFDLTNPHRVILELRNSKQPDAEDPSNPVNIAAAADPTTISLSAKKASQDPAPVETAKLLTPRNAQPAKIKAETKLEPAKEDRTASVKSALENAAVSPTSPVAAPAPAVQADGEAVMIPSVTPDKKIAATIFSNSLAPQAKSAPAKTAGAASPATVASAASQPQNKAAEKKPLTIRDTARGVPDNSTATRKPAKGEIAAAEPVAESIREAQPNRDGTRSLTRALGLKIGRIILDPGHGGYDTGTIGPGGLNEKELVLDVSQRLGKLISQRMGSEVLFTREDDTFVPLEMRTSIANEKQADLFLSIHANSSSSPAARGIETYYLSFATDPAALAVAARENAVSQESIHQLQDLLKKIALHEKADESREFAADVQSALHDRLSRDNRMRKDRGVKKAPFMVLVGARMPSVLAEIAFLSNPQEEKLLRTPRQRQKIAEALYSGIAKYVDTLSGVKVKREANIASAAAAR